LFVIIHAAGVITLAFLVLIGSPAL